MNYHQRIFKTYGNSSMLPVFNYITFYCLEKAFHNINFFKILNTASVLHNDFP